MRRSMVSLALGLLVAGCGVTNVPGPTLQGPRHPNPTTTTGPCCPNQVNPATSTDPCGPGGSDGCTKPY